MAGGHLGYKKGQKEDSGFFLEKMVPEVIEILKPFEQKFGKEIPVMYWQGLHQKPGCVPVNRVNKDELSPTYTKTSFSCPLAE